MDFFLHVLLSFAMAKKKFYAVSSGRETGVFLSWEECKKQVSKRFSFDIL
jgi:hypothetical protein